MRKSLHILIVLFITIVILIILSLCPWDEWTGGRLKRFNLLSDILPQKEATVVSANENIDPEFSKLLEKSDSIVSDKSHEDTTVIREIPADFIAPKIDGTVLIEDYSIDNNGLSKLAAILSEASKRRVRIAMVGDSYIEGDILAQDIREGLQERYGGRGVGYVAAFSEFPGFRSSVNQTASGWEAHEIRNMNNDALRTILGTYFVAEEGSGTNTRFRKSVKPKYVDFWENTTVLFVAPDSGTIKLSSPDFDEVTYTITADSNLQGITLAKHTGDIRFKTDIPSLKVLGFWLEGNKGIVLDDISLRGNSGISHRSLNPKTTAEMREFVDYDFIILEFGMNALSASQTNYTAYGTAITEVVKNLKNLYPNAQILIMGVGDRGYKNGTEMGSMPTINAIIKAQRDAALHSGVLFWDTREAMGGDGAAVEWHERKLVNSDYIHLNHHGGKELASLFLKSLFLSIGHTDE